MSGIEKGAERVQAQGGENSPEALHPPRPIIETPDEAAARATALDRVHGRAERMRGNPETMRHASTTGGAHAETIVHGSHGHGDPHKVKSFFKALTPRSLGGKLMAGTGIVGVTGMTLGTVAGMFGIEGGFAVAGLIGAGFGIAEALLGFPILMGKILDWMRDGKLDLKLGSGKSSASSGGGGHGGGH